MSNPTTTTHDPDDLASVARTRAFLRALARRRRVGLPPVVPPFNSKWLSRGWHPPPAPHVAAAAVTDLLTGRAFDSFERPEPPAVFERSPNAPATPRMARASSDSAPSGADVADTMPAPATRSIDPPTSAPSVPSVRFSPSTEVARLARLRDRVEAAAPRVLDHVAVSALGQSGGPAPAIRFVANDAADELARRHRADAVAFGSVVAVRPDKFRPRTSAGIGLLAHEIEHVSAATGPPAARREPVVEEQAALAREARTVASLASPEESQPTVRRPDLTPPSGPFRAASEDRRPAAENVPKDETVMPAAQLTSDQLRALEDHFMRRLTARIKTDLERGA